jgi:predicted dehydrogenase
MSPPLQKDPDPRGTARAQGNGQRKIRYALVGAGNIAQVAVLPGIRNAGENSELVAIVSGDADKRRVLAEQHGVEHTGSYEELEQVLERGRVDAVYIATPNHLHREHTERAARAKVHVLCEKPMAPTIADCEAMRDVCRAEGVQLMLAYRLHFDEATIAALEIVQSGQIGRPKLFTSLLTQQVRPGDIRTRHQPGAGGLFDLGVYPINAARHLFQAEPVRVLCSITRGDDRFAGVDASAAATLIFSEERIAQFSVSLDSFARSSYRVLGESGELAVDPGYAYDEGLRHILWANGRRIEQTFPKRDQFGAQIAAFSAALLEHREVEPSAEEGLRDVRVVQALLEAAARGRAVDLPPLPPGLQPSRRQIRAKPGVSTPQTFKAPAPIRS